MAHQYSNDLNCLFLKQILLLVLVCKAGATAKVPSIIVFGDSTVDAGNNNDILTIVKSNFEPYGQDFEGGKATGRFCNGRLPTDFISESFGIKTSIPAYLDPEYSIEEFATGVTFASAGTGFDNVTSSVYSVIPLSKELEYFQEYQETLKRTFGNLKATVLLSEALYIISLGTNDFILNYYLIPSRSIEFTVDEYQDLLIRTAENFILNIFQLGAKKIAITGLSPIGCLPVERTTDLLRRACVEDYNKDARNYNVKLQNLVSNLSKNFTAMKLVYLNVYDPIQDVIQNPEAYGFENVDLGCCGTGTFEFGLACNLLSIDICADVNKYVFWDAVHPSEKLYKILSDAFLRTSLADFR